MELLKTEFIEGDPPVLRVDGEIDLSTADLFRTALEDAVSTHPNVVVDLARVSFLDAAGLRVLVQVAATRNGAGPIPLVNAQRVAWVLDLVGLSSSPSIAIRALDCSRGR